MIPEIEVDFRLYGLGILPEDITNILGIFPTKAWCAGDPFEVTELRKGFKKRTCGYLLQNNERKLMIFLIYLFPC